MKIGRVVKFRRKPEAKEECLGLVVGKDDEFFRVYDPRAKRIYDVFKTELWDAYDVITLQNTFRNV